MDGNWKWSGRLFLGVIFTLLILGIGKPAPAQGAESPQLTVGSQGQYPDIRSAVAAAQPGQTISVEPGVYRERLSINKPLTLRGQVGAILDGGGQETIILITNTQDVTVYGLSLRNSGGPAMLPYAGVKVVQSKNVTVDHVKMSDIEHGVYLEQSSDCRIKNNEISGKVSLLPEDRGDAIGLWKSDHNIFSNNHAWNVRDGIKFEFSTFNQVSSNQFEHLRYGLHYMYSNDNTFDHNLFEDDVAGATPMYSKRIQFTDNIFANMPGERGYAILLQDSDDCVIKNNLIMQSNVGLHFDHSNHNVVEGNMMISCGVAIRVLGTSTENTFVGNNAEDNVIQVGSDYQALPNTWSVKGYGNYWSDYRGYDFTGGGIGDLPYNSVSYLARAVYEQPLLELFADSPGIQALSQGLQMFPLWQLPSIQDQYPLMHPTALPAEWQPYLNSTAAKGSSILFAALSIAALLVAWAILRRGWRRRETHA
ncbi:nitrous oxide reductase family maturation protein NosD [Desulfosporosinus sp. SB140]|uniref:nitrous oxide reductase family maturation protein NosD n=1 Tax=Desulfosporosinus paludis TaxID=3115649 RepID=UPI00388EBE7A